ncbi:hypothetical protein D3C84_273220 [compost metagenome]
MEQLQRVEFDLQARLEHADHRGGTATGQHGERLLGGLLEADAFERVVHTATGQLHHLLGGITVAAVDHIGGAELPGQLQLRVEHVDGDDPPCSGQRRAVDRGQADTAATDHGHGLARPHLGGVEHRAGAGGDRATEQGGAVQRHVAADRHAGVFVHQHLLGEPGQVDELRHRFVHVGQAWLFVLATFGFRRHAARQMAGHAVIAVATEHRQAGDHMIAGLDRTHFGADLLDHTGGFMTQHHRAGIGKRAVDDVQVRVAHTHRFSADQHFARTRFADAHLFDDQRGSNLMEYGSFHGSSLNNDVGFRPGWPLYAKRPWHD